MCLVTRVVSTCLAKKCPIRLEFNIHVLTRQLTCHTAFRCHPAYEDDQEPGRRRFEQSQESRVTSWNHVKKTKVIEYGCIWSSVVTNVHQGANHRIGGGGESHQTSGTIMIKSHLYCYRSSLWQLV